MEYSDLGFILLGAVVVAVTGVALPDFCRQAIFGPLQMDSTGWLPAAPHRYAATERGNQVEQAMCGQEAASFPHWRRHVIRGEANDGNAW